MKKKAFFFKEIVVLILREITCQCNVLDIVEVFFFALEILFYLNDTFFCPNFKEFDSSSKQF